MAHFKAAFNFKICSLYMNLVRNYGSGLDSVVASIIKRCAKDPNQPSTCSLTKHLRLSLR